MKISIQSIALKNFKGIKNYVVLFDGEDTEIYGKNFSGKTTIADAWTWLLFGKNARWETAFDVKPVGMERPEVEVEAEIKVDDQEILLKKVMTEKWVTRRGFDEETFSGHETKTYINGLEKKAGEYKAYIDTLVTEDTFKRLTSAQAFLSMKKQDMRKVLLDIGGDVSDTQVAGDDEDLNYILTFAGEQDMTIEEVQKLAKQNVTAYTAEQTNISPRIDEIRRMMPDDQDWSKLEAGLEKGREYLRQIDAQLATGTASAQVQRKKQAELYAVQNKIDEMKRTRLEAANKEYTDLLREKDSVQQIIKVNRMNRDSINESLEELNAEIKRMSERLVVLKQDWLIKDSKRKAIIATEFEPVEAGDCPRCGQPLPEDQIEQMNADAEKRFNQEKQEELEKAESRLSETTENGVELSTMKKKRLERKATLEEDLKKSEAEIDLAEKTLDDLERKLSTKSLAVEIDLTGDIAFEELVAQRNQIQTEMEAPDNSSEKLLANKAKLTEQMESIRELLQGKSEREKALNRIAELEKRGKELAGLIAIERRKQRSVEKFIHKKAEMLEQSINRLFDGLEFRLFEQQINGGIVDDCTPMIKGVEYKDASNSERIRADMAIVKTFQKLESTYVPYFVDNAEACNYFIDMDTQVIKLFVSTDEQLRIERGN